MINFNGFVNEPSDTRNYLGSQLITILKVINIEIEI